MNVDRWPNRRAVHTATSGGQNRRPGLGTVALLTGAAVLLEASAAFFLAELGWLVLQGERWGEFEPAADGDWYVPFVRLLVLGVFPLASLVFCALPAVWLGDRSVGVSLSLVASTSLALFATRAESLLFFGWKELVYLGAVVFGLAPAAGAYLALRRARDHATSSDVPSRPQEPVGMLGFVAAALAVATLTGLLCWVTARYAEPGSCRPLQSDPPSASCTLEAGWPFAFVDYVALVEYDSTKKVTPSPIEVAGLTRPDDRSVGTSELLERGYRLAQVKRSYALLDLAFWAVPSALAVVLLWSLAVLVSRLPPALQRR